jgi:peroxiredoxin
MDSNDTNIGRWTDDRLASLRPAGEWRPDTARGLSLFKERRAASDLWVRQRTWAAGAALAVCASIVAFPVTRAFAQRCVDACVGETTRVSGFLWRGFSTRDTIALSIAESPFKPPSDRKMAPDFTLPDASGNAVRLSDFRGRVVLLNFWATWCVPCKTEIPWFVEFERNYRDRNFAVLGVSFDDDGWKAVKPYMGAQKINYPIVIGGGDLSGAYGGHESLPTTLLIDKEGRIAVIHVGLCGKTDYEAEIKTLLDEQIQ